MALRESLLKGIWNRTLQSLARSAPGATTLRVMLHRWRGVKIGQNVWIGQDAMIETSRPELVTIGNYAWIGIRSTIIAHMRECEGVTIEDYAIVGPCAIVLPNVTIGRGSLITAGSVVSKSVPPMTMVQGNPAKPIAKIGIPLGRGTSLKEFSKHLKPIRE